MHRKMIHAHVFEPQYVVSTFERTAYLILRQPNTKCVYMCDRKEEWKTKNEEGQIGSFCQNEKIYKE